MLCCVAHGAESALLPPVRVSVELGLPGGDSLLGSVAKGGNGVQVGSGDGHRCVCILGIPLPFHTGLIK